MGGDVHPIARGTGTAAQAGSRNATQEATTEGRGDEARGTMEATSAAATKRGIREGTREGMAKANGPDASGRKATLLPGDEEMSP